MIERRTFAMGEFIAELPCDRYYIKNHMWAMEIPQDGALPHYRFGFSAYAVRLLQDIYFIDFDCVPGSRLKDREEFGSIESKKAESGMYSPMAGEVIEINEQILDDPSLINVDKYGQGWLFRLRPSTGTDLQSILLTTDAYIEHLDSAWAVAQRTIKGQANTDD